MLEVWRPFSKKQMGKLLTREQLAAIISARPDPESPIGEAIKEKAEGPVH
jgi:hypothetical protein